MSSREYLFDPLISIVAAGLICLTAWSTLPGETRPAAAPNVTYTATGTFSGPQVSGQDQFKLAGQDFSISVVANEAAVPASHGGNWAKYTQLKMLGTVNSGLFPTPFAISSSYTALELATGNPAYNVFAMFAPINVMGKAIYISTVLQMPVGTIVKGKNLIVPFTAPVTLSPSSGTVVYSDPATGASTVLTIASGTLSTTVSGAAR